MFPGVVVSGQHNYILARLIIDSHSTTEYWLLTSLRYSTRQYWAEGYLLTILLLQVLQTEPRPQTMILRVWWGNWELYRAERREEGSNIVFQSTRNNIPDRAVLTWPEGTPSYVILSSWSDIQYFSVNNEIHLTFNLYHLIKSCKGYINTLTWTKHREETAHKSLFSPLWERQHLQKAFSLSPTKWCKEGRRKQSTKRFTTWDITSLKRASSFRIIWRVRCGESGMIRWSVWWSPV